MSKKKLIALSPKILPFSFIVSFIVLLMPLVYSIFQSGFNYLLNGDELTHAQTTYLIIKGEKPFETFFSAYSPLFHWLFTPIYKFIGFNFQAIFFNRFIMTTLLLVRIVLAFFFAKKVFGKKVACLFILLWLFDPFTTFSGMQIRPDNLALTVYTLGLLIFTYGIFNQSKVLTFISGIIISLALLISMKILPSSFSIILIFLFYCILKKRIARFIFFLSGLILPIILFFGYYFLRGSLGEMFSQVFIESQQIVNYWFSFAPLGMLFMPNNDTFYGLPGRPANWVYVWILPIIGFAGALQAFSAIVKQKKFEVTEMLTIILVLSLVGQWSVLFYAQSVFAQYFLPITWLMALFGALFIKELINSVQSIKFLQVSFVACLLFLLINLYATSIRANLGRAKITWQIQVQEIEKLWQRFPENEPVFQNILFRPLAYPVPVGYNIELFPKERIEKLPDLASFLEKKAPKEIYIPEHVVINFQYIKPGWRDYIFSHYEKTKEQDVWVRKNP